MHLILTLLLPLLPLTSSTPISLTNLSMNPSHQTNTTTSNTTKILPGHAKIHNNCTHPIYIWSIPPSPTPSPPQTTLNSTQTYTEPYRHDPQTGGISLKLTTTPNGIYTGAAQTIFAYNFVDERVWYDLSDVGGHAFEGWRVSVSRVLKDSGRGNGGNGEREEEVIVWERGVPGEVGDGNKGGNGNGSFSRQDVPARLSYC
ncbi:hypothetical protein BO71DRAFT_460078 [Aspergillus ellipticus CBS 707.79]|uniref:Uncharacterized protein n=1 Tax=Aspergillus ellipticus CBS 707.79 TaxID=1448320 RepID=A0A319DJL7_9EURO|nr:hypothetical protein BO71DRAFT_460078 [Aspergillus ellipticus CBS 707.79]